MAKRPHGPFDRIHHGSTGKVTLLGDADCSGVVDVSDAVLAAKFSVGDSDVLISDIGQLNADCDDSGKITTADDMIDFMAYEDGQ